MKAKQYLLPLAIVLLGALLQKYLPSLGMLNTIIFTAIYFAFGMSLSMKNKPSKDVLPKVVSILLLILLTLYELGYLQMALFTQAMVFLNLHGIFGVLLKVYCGYLYKA
ncbi:MAG: hypothetical protein ACRCZJ_05000 [Erysipelotrichaceae bacterium]